MVAGSRLRFLKTYTPIKVAVFISFLLHAMMFMHLKINDSTGEAQYTHNFRLRMETYIADDTDAAESKKVSEPNKTLTSYNRINSPRTSLMTDDTVASKQEMQPSTERSNRQGEQISVEDKYIEQLLREIEQHKFYPSLARRRGIEDTITVEFLLKNHQEIAGLQVRGSSSLLEAVTRKVVYAALPFTVVPDEVHLPLKIRFQIYFKLE